MDEPIPNGLDGKMYKVDPKVVKLAEDEMIPYAKALQITFDQIKSAVLEADIDQNQRS